MAAGSGALIATALRADGAAVGTGRTDRVRAMLSSAVPAARGAAAALLAG
jgi:hypothetical protein